MDDPTVGAGGYHILSLFSINHKQLIYILRLLRCVQTTHVYIYTTVSQFPECMQNLFPHPILFIQQNKVTCISSRSNDNVNLKVHRVVFLLHTKETPSIFTHCLRTVW